MIHGKNGNGKKGQLKKTATEETSTKKLGNFPLPIFFSLPLFL